MDEQESNSATEASREADDDAIAVLREELAASRTNERAAVERLRTALVANDPALEPGMLTGETLAEVEASYARASALLAKVRERAAVEVAGRVPVGAPGRHVRRPRTAFEKIRDGLSKGA